MRRGCQRHIANLTLEQVRGDDARG
ncbi:hypothetical protein Q604_UNBC06534G0001, partial [human gut metagenome]